MNKTYIIAGNNQQFTDFVKNKLLKEFDHSIANDIPFNKSMSDYVHVREPHQLVGITNPKGYLIGTWRELPEIKSILINLQISTMGRVPVIRELYDKL
jgi:uncharacterized membrane protein